MLATDSPGQTFRAQRRHVCTAPAAWLASKSIAADQPSPRHRDRRWYEAAESMRQMALSWGDQPYGVVLVTSAGLVAEGPSRVIKNSDPDAHAEREAIREAQRRLGTQALTGSWFHTDAAQSLGKIPVNVEDLQVDFLTLAGHKFYAPKGIGALYVRPGCEFVPLLHGGGQEGGRRASTENVPHIAGLGEACRLARERGAADRQRLTHLRDRLHQRLLAGFPELRLNGPVKERLPNTLNVSFTGFSGRAILAGLPELAASLGAACHGEEEAPSPVLTAMGLPRAAALSAVRLSVGRYTTDAEVDEAATMLLGRVKQLSQ